MAGFDSFLNTAVPIAVALFFLFLLINALKKPLKGIWEMFGGVRERFSNRGEEIKQIGEKGLAYE